MTYIGTLVKPTPFWRPSIVSDFSLASWSMSIADNLRQLRRDRGLTLQQMADLVGLHLNQIRRYETAETQPSLEALKKIALAFSISTDALIFDEDERGPDEALKLKFEAIRQFDDQERAIIEGVLDSLIVQHQAKRLFARPVESDKAKSASGKHSASR